MMSSHDNNRGADTPSDVLGEGPDGPRARTGNPADRKPGPPTGRRMRGNPGDRK